MIHIGLGGASPTHRRSTHLLLSMLDWKPFHCGPFRGTYAWVHLAQTIIMVLKQPISTKGWIWGVANETAFWQKAQWRYIYPWQLGRRWVRAQVNCWGPHSGFLWLKPGCWAAQLEIKRALQRGIDLVVDSH